jgi:hypothetical protein
LGRVSAMQLTTDITVTNVNDAILKMFRLKKGGRETVIKTATLPAATLKCLALSNRYADMQFAQGCTIQWPPNTVSHAERASHYRLQHPTTIAFP